MKIGLGINIDVTKIDKSRLKDGKYLDLTGFVDLDNEDKYGKNGFITQSMTKEEREQNVRLPILGIARCFIRERVVVISKVLRNQRQTMALMTRASPFSHARV